MNALGRMAMDHARRFRPKSFAQIRNPEEFYQALGEEVDDLIEQMVTAMNPRTPEEYLSLSHQIESDLIRELVLLEPEMEDDELAA